MLAVAAADSSLMLLAGGLLLGLGYGTRTSTGHALAVFASPMKHVGRATAVFAIVLYWALIGRTGFFSCATMRRVRRLRVEEVRTDGE